MSTNDFIIFSLFKKFPTVVPVPSLVVLIFSEFNNKFIETPFLKEKHACKLLSSSTTTTK